MRNFLYIGLVSLATLLSCNQADDNPGHNPCPGDEAIYYITSSDLMNCRYKTNSYWVCFDSVTNTFDSISIESFNQDFIEDYCRNSFEIHSFKTISSNSLDTTDYVVFAGGLFKDFDGTTHSGIKIYDDYNTTTSMAVFLVEHFDSVFIYDQYYKKVLRVERENDPTEDHNKSIYYFNSEFGFLRHDIYSDNSLISKKVLLRKNIVR